MLNYHGKEVELSNVKVSSKEELEAIHGKVVYAAGSIMEYVCKKHALTRRMVRVPSIDAFNAVNKETSENRLTRFLGLEKRPYLSSSKVVLSDGRKVEMQFSRFIHELPDDEIIYMTFYQDSEKDPVQHQLHEMSVEAIRDGFMYNGSMYEYLMSSASQMRTLKGVFVREDYELPESYTRKISDIDYRHFLKSLRGMEALLEVMSSGAYSHQWTNRFDQFMGIDSQPPVESPSKVMARAGLALSSTIAIGNSWEVKRIGYVRYIWTDKLEAAIHKANPILLDGDIELMKRLWKEEKADGMSLISAEKLAKELRKRGVNVRAEDLVGKLIQGRYAGVKGTFLVLPKATLNMIPEYRGYDIIVEKSSDKHICLDHYTGELAPYFEMANISKGHFSNNLTYQFITALDGEEALDPRGTIKALKEIADEQTENFRKVFQGDEEGISIAKAMLGMTYIEDVAEKLGLDAYETTVNRSKLLTALEKDSRVVTDRWWRKKFMSLFINKKDEAKLGKLLVEGATRYIITDPISMLRADLMDENGDIIITDPSQVGLGGPADVYWADKSGEAVLFRSPCIHPGEPQRVNLKGLSSIPEFIKTGYGNLPVRSLYASMPNLIIISGFGSILENLGGADTDGDMALIVIDPRIVKLRSKNRKPQLTELPSTTMKEVITPESLKENMARSLRDNGIGLITDYATTIRDIQLHHVSKRGKVDKKIRKALVQMRTEARTVLKDDPTNKDVVAIAQMDVDKWDDVYRACNAALKTLRMLQEMAINTAKSGVFVDFDDYKYLTIKIRASWHRPLKNQNFLYHSASPMGLVSAYVQQKWDELKELAEESSKSLIVDDNKSDFGANWTECYTEVNKLKIRYGLEVQDLTEREREGELAPGEFSESFEAITTEIHDQLTLISTVYGVDMVAVAAYEASNANSQRKKSNTGSFVWNCYFEELMMVLRYFQQDVKTDQRLVPVFLYPEFNYDKFEIGTKVTVVCEEAILGEKVVGRVLIDDGEYETSFLDGRLFILKTVPKDTISELNASIAGVSVMVLGLDKNKVGGQVVTRESLTDMLAASGNVLYTKSKVMKRGDEDRYYVAFYVKADDRYCMVGTTSSVANSVKRALANKAIVVSPKAVQKTNGDKNMEVVIEEVVHDYNK